MRWKNCDTSHDVTVTRWSVYILPATGQVHTRSDGDTLRRLRLALRRRCRRHTLPRDRRRRDVAGSDVIAGNDVAVGERERPVDHRLRAGDVETGGDSDG